MKCKWLVTLSAFAITVPLIFLAGCSNSNTQSTGQKAPGAEQAVADAIDVYVYGYPLVTMDMTRRQMTNVATPERNPFTDGAARETAYLPPSRDAHRYRSQRGHALHHCVG